MVRLMGEVRGRLNGSERRLFLIDFEYAAPGDRSVED
jgi:hypothetical protein